jgi:hypothetical protein
MSSRPSIGVRTPSKTIGSGGAVHPSFGSHVVHSSFGSHVGEGGGGDGGFIKGGFQSGIGKSRWRVCVAGSPSDFLRTVPGSSSRSLSSTIQFVALTTGGICVAEFQQAFPYSINHEFRAVRVTANPGLQQVLNLPQQGRRETNTNKSTRLPVSITIFDHYSNIHPLFRFATLTNK